MSSMKRRCARSAVAGGCLVLMWGFAAQAEQGPDGFPDSTLAGVYELAVKNDLGIAQARAELRVGREERLLARAGLLPQIQGGFDYSEVDTESRGEFSVGAQTFPNSTDTDAD